MEYKAPNSDWYEKNNLTPPKVEVHGTESDVRDNMMKLLPTKWHQEGNKLIGETAWGELVNYLPPDMMLKGTDEKGLPILEKIVL